jgi:hypothetical protein
MLFLEAAAAKLQFRNRLELVNKSGSNQLPLKMWFCKAWARKITGLAILF